MVLLRISKLVAFVVVNSCTQMASAWTAEWINLNLDVGRSIEPPRSGHVAFGLNDKIYVFGGYAEDTTTAERYPTNDLWCFCGSDGTGDSKWTLVKPASSSQPQPRLAAAAVTFRLDEDTPAGLVLGGWDSQKAGTGGVILKDVQVFSENDGEGGSWDELPTDLEQPTSRLCAVPLGDQILVHNHRCTDHVLLLSVKGSELLNQPTSGTAPSARGLHVAVRLPGTSKVVVFGGAAQSGSMSNEVFVLDTDKWIWEDCSVSEAEDMPCPRASPCMVALDEKSCIVFGGATPTSEAGLHGCNDTWLLELEESATDDESSTKTVAKWTRLSEDGSADAPPGRNAASLMPLSSMPRVLGKEIESGDSDNPQYFLLSGGWYPFRTTYRDNFVLKVTKTNTMQDSQ